MSDYLLELQEQVKKGKNVFIAPNAYVLGKAELGDEVSVWYGATIRADFDKIVIGNQTNIQEGCSLHVDHGIPMKIGNGVTVGHHAVLHGCTIDDYSLIGINATVLNSVKIGKGCVIGANSLVTERTIIPDFSLVFGSPAKVVKTLNEETFQLLKFSAQEYVNEAAKYLK